MMPMRVSMIRHQPSGHPGARCSDFDGSLLRAVLLAVPLKIALILGRKSDANLALLRCQNLNAADA